MSKVCSDCQFSIQDFPDLFCTVRKLSTKDGLFVNCHHYLPKTIFDRITTSPEVLAPHFVFLKAVFVTNINPQQQWISTLAGDVYPTKAEAIAATVARLKEVEK